MPLPRFTTPAVILTALALTASIGGCSLDSGSPSAGRFVDSGVQAAPTAQLPSAVVPAHMVARISAQQTCVLEYGGTLTYEPYGDYDGQIYLRYREPRVIREGNTIQVSPQGPQKAPRRNDMCREEHTLYLKGSSPAQLLAQLQQQYIATGKAYQSQWREVAQLTVVAGARTGKYRPVKSKQVVAAMNLAPIRGVGFWSQCTIASPGTIQSLGMAAGAQLYRYASTASRKGDCPSGSLVQLRRPPTDLSFAYVGSDSGLGSGGDRTVSFPTS